MFVDVGVVVFAVAVFVGFPAMVLLAALMCRPAALLLLRFSVTT